MSIIDIVITLLVIFWLAGFALRVGGSLIHLLIAIAVVIFVARLLGMA